MAFALVFLAAVIGPALDFLPSHMVPAQYSQAVHALSALLICQPPLDRPVQMSNADRPGGDTLVRPPEFRRVNVVAGYERHFQAAKLLSFGGFMPSELRIPSDAACAAKKAVELQHSGMLLPLRARVSSVLAHHGEILRPFSLELNQQLMPKHIKRISQGMNVLLLAALTDALQLRDRDIARCFWMGFQALGEIPDSRAHRALVPISPLERSQFQGKFALIMATNEAWHDKMENFTKLR